MGDGGLKGETAREGAEGVDCDDKVVVALEDVIEGDATAAVRALGAFDVDGLRA